MPFTLGEIATTGLPAGEHIVRIDDIEASINSAKTNETLVFKATVAQSENPKVKVGLKQIWSYTYAEEWRSIIANDLVRAGLAKELRLEGNAKADAIVMNQYMRGNFYVIKVVVQKGDSTRTNTTIVRPYSGAGAPAGAAPLAPAPVGAPPNALESGAASPAAPPMMAPAPIVPPAPLVAAPPRPVAPGAPPAPVAPPAPAAAAPAPVAPVAPPVAAVEPRLNGELIQAVTLATSGQGLYPPLNATQIAQLREIGMETVADLYDAARQPAAPPPPPAPTVPISAAFAAV